MYTPTLSAILLRLGSSYFLLLFLLQNKLQSLLCLEYSRTKSSGVIWFLQKTQPNSTQPIGVQGVLGVCINLCANHQLHLYNRYKYCVWGKASLGFKSLFWGKELNKLNRVSQFD